MNSPRQILAYIIVCLFLLFFLSSGIDFQATSSVLEYFSTSSSLPDFSHYNELRTLSSKEYPIDDRDKRVIIVGDVHGSDEPLHRLLDKLNYKARYDEFIHVGDIIAKGSHKGSLAVLSYMARHNITGVRGNHDQKVIEWRAWMDWVVGLPGGKRWLAEIDSQSEKHLDASKDIVSEDWVQKELGRMGRKWRRKIPRGWKLFSDHYRVARDMSKKDYAYLRSLPLVLHVPEAHTYIVHAGLLPYDPTRDQTHHRQPLSHIPYMLQGIQHDVARLRLLQELGILHDIPQNTDPWVTLNMRSVKKNNRVTKSSKEGTPWSDIWNAAMGRCDGFGRKAWEETNDVKGKKKSLPCRPATVVYGHAASRGLDVKRWSIGTDSGCVYGRRLSALVLGSSSHLASPSSEELDGDDRDFQGIPYGDDGRGRIVSVSCH